MAPQLQPQFARAHLQQAEGPLAAVDLPATGIGIQEQMQYPLGRQLGRQGPQARLGLVQVVQHAHRVDVVEAAAGLQIQQAALLDAQLLHLGGGPGAAGALSRQLQGSAADIHRQHPAARVEVAQVVGAHPGAAACIEDAPAAGCASGGS